MYFIEPLPLNAPALLLNLWSSQQRRAALQASANSFTQVVSAPINLVQETEAAKGVLLFQPLYNYSNTSFVDAVLRPAAILETALSGTTPEPLAVTINDVTDVIAERVAHVKGSSASWEVVQTSNPDFEKSYSGEPTRFTFGQRQYSITVTRLPGFGAAQEAVSQDVALFSAVVAGVISLVVILCVVMGARRVVATVNKARTAADAASQAKGDFIAYMAHELRNPLSAILFLSGIV